MTSTFQECYRILRAPEDCTWKELRLAYRRQVRRCHPDLQASDNARIEHNAQLLRVVRAYRLIARFHRDHGSLPPPWLLTDDTGDRIYMQARPVHAHYSASDSTHRGERTAGARWRAPGIHVAVFAAFVSGVSAAALVERLEDNGQSESAARSVEDGELAVGMDPGAVVRIHGVPNHTRGSIWFYGDSGVIFDEGCVIGWENQSPYPLRAMSRTAYRESPPPSGTTSTVILPVHETRNGKCPLSGS